MAIPGKTKDLLLQLVEKLPADRRSRFGAAVNSRLDLLQSENTVYGALLGGALGAVLEMIPGAELLTGIDDWVEVGIALGAWVGYAKDRKEQRERERIATVIKEAVHEAFA